MIYKRLKLSRNAFGRLVMTRGRRVHDNVTPVRSFPISAPDEGIALVGTDGAELMWIERLEDLPEDARALVQEELDSREFMPQIHRIRQVSSFATPSRWQVETDRGDAILVLKAEEDIRRLSASTLLIADSQGVHFLVRDVASLDKGSRRLLDHFL